MTLDEVAKYMQKINEGHIEEWDDFDQMKFFLELGKFIANVKPLVDKYDTTEPFKFEFRRLYGG